MRLLGLKTPDATYGRSKSVVLDNGTCDMCGRETEILATDSSDDEYGAVNLCKNCIDSMPWGRLNELVDRVKGL